MNKTTTRSGRLLYDACEAKTGDALAKLVLINLANRANDDGECWPSIARIAQDCECTERSVIRKLELLEQLGFIFRIHRSEDGIKTSNLYRFPKNTQGFSVVTQSHIDVTSAYPDVTQSHDDVTQSHDPSDTESPTLVTQSHINHPIETPNETPSDCEPTFDQFYDAYGKKVQKKAAEKAWSKLELKEKLAAVDRVRSKQFKSWFQATGKYVPHPATWLNAGQWEDDISSDSDTEEVFGI